MELTNDKLNWKQVYWHWVRPTSSKNHKNPFLVSDNTITFFCSPFQHECYKTISFIWDLELSCFKLFQPGTLIKLPSFFRKNPQFCQFGLCLCTRNWNIDWTSHFSDNSSHTARLGNLQILLTLWHMSFLHYRYTTRNQNSGNFNQ